MSWCQRPGCDGRCWLRTHRSRPSCDRPGRTQAEKQKEKQVNTSTLILLWGLQPI